MTEPISVACGGHGPTRVSGMGRVSVWAHPTNLWKTWAHTTHLTVVESPHRRHTLQAQTYRTWHQHNSLPVYLRCQCFQDGIIQMIHQWRNDWGGHGPTLLSGAGTVSVWAHLPNLWKTWAHTTDLPVADLPLHSRSDTWGAGHIIVSGG